MRGIIKGTGEEEAALLAGDAEITFCVFDAQQRVHHFFCTAPAVDSLADRFQFLSDPATAFEHPVLAEAVRTNQPASVSVAVGGGRRTFLSILPYIRKWKQWHYACVQIFTTDASSDVAASAASALAEDRVCLLLVNCKNSICSVGPRVPATFGYSAAHLMGMRFCELFSSSDFDRICECPPDSNQSVHQCVLRGPEGGRCDVELKKLSMPEQYSLYAIVDVTQPDLAEAIAEVGIRERRRIGQDLHDSIGQLLTGISLLSRSLANRLSDRERADFADAAQISELADEASNQIRQISRSLMPPEIIQRGLCESLRELARMTTASCGLECETRVECAMDFVEAAVETHLYRIAQEAVNNAVRHAGASRITIGLTHEAEMVKLEISDNGRWKKPLGNCSGIGLKTMGYRAKAVGGHIEVIHTEAAGTRVLCRIKSDDALATRL